MKKFESKKDLLLYVTVKYQDGTFVTYLSPSWTKKELCKRRVADYEYINKMQTMPSQTFEVTEEMSVKGYFYKGRSWEYFFYPGDSFSFNPNEEVFFKYTRKPDIPTQSRLTSWLHTIFS